MLNKIKNKIRRYQKAKHKRRVNEFTKKYIADNNLGQLIALADELSGSKSPAVTDYVLLHSLVRSKKPKYMLECGTGKSTWIIADAIRANYLKDGIEGKLISMENYKEWHDQAISILPEQLKPFVDIILSPRATYMHSFIKGTVYEKVPEYPYEIVFVDGPDYTIRENDKDNIAANMDFIRVLYSSQIPVTAVVDYRLNSVIAYGILLGKKHVQFIKPWSVGLIENVTKKDLLEEDKHNPGDALELLGLVANVQYKEPSWIKL